MPRAGVLAVVALLALASGRVRAQPNSSKSPAELEVSAAQHFYETGHYADAAQHFRAAYDLEPEPAYLFDAAQAYRFAKDCAKAATFYAKFLAVVKPDQTANLDKVKRYLAEMQACAKPAPAGTTTGTTAPPPPPPSIGTTTEVKSAESATEPASSQAQPVATVSTSTAGSPPERSHLRRNLAFAAGGVGVVAVVVGIYFAHQIHTVETDRANIVAGCPSPACTGKNLANLDSRGHRDSALAVTGYTVGAAALAAGIALYVLDRNDHERAVAVVPTRGGAAVGAVFTF